MCIRDRLSRGRMREHYKYLVDRKGPERADVTIEEIEKNPKKYY